MPPQAGYRGLENQLYRVEVHTPGPVGTATFKWSRDNATVASRVTHINPSRTRITVESLGRDDVLTFHDGEWVEVTDDWRELHGLPGELRRIAPASGVDRTARTLTFETALTDGLFPDRRPAGDRPHPQHPRPPLGPGRHRPRRGRDRSTPTSTPPARAAS